MNSSMSNPATAKIPVLGVGNYESWKRSMKMFLMSEGLWGFVDETDKLDDKATPKEKKKWEKRRNKTLGYIYIYVSETKKSNIDECKTPKESWDELQRIYEPSSRARQAQKRREFLQLCFERNEEMSDFLSRVDHAVRSLKLIKEINPQHHAYQYLDFLPEEYNQATFAIHHWPDVDFTVKKVADQLLAEYVRLSSMGGRVESNNGATRAYANSTDRPNAYFQPQRNLSTFTCYNCGQTSHISRKCPHPRRKRDNSSNRRDDRRPDYRDNRRDDKRSYFNCNDDNRQRRNRSRDRGRDEDRYEHNRSSSASKLTRDSAFLVANMHSDQVTDTSAPAAAFGSADTKNEWFLDCGATDHVSFHRKWFINFVELTPFNLILGEGESKVTGKGDIVLLTKCNSELCRVTLKNVLFAPDFRANLISVSRMDKARYHLHIYDYTLTVYAQKISEPALIAKLKNGLYHLEGAEIQLNTARVKFPQLNESTGDMNTYSASKEGKHQTGDKRNNYHQQTRNYSTKAEDLTRLWHSRVGHMNLKSMKKLANNSQVYGLDRALQIFGQIPM
uniref:CCHC-type domain-containing protein n=1 Tax=Strigamia maritima TaxID=126957 RepID=T1IQ85_STRMM